MEYCIRLLYLFSLLLLATSFVGKNQNKLKTGFYYLAEKESEGMLISDIDSDETFAVENKEVLTVDDFSDAKLEKRNFRPNAMKVIELKLTKDGRKKWSAIIKRITKTGEMIVFVCNDKIYLEKRMAGKTHLDNPTLDLFIGPKYQETILKIIKTEISGRKQLQP